MKYDILYAVDTPELVSAVNAAIQEGWKPIGGVAVGSDFNVHTSRDSDAVSGETSFVFCQAMVKGIV